jgi:hypothetical protein
MNEPITIVVPLNMGGTIALGTVLKGAFKVPTDANGGGISILAAGVVSANAIASGSAPLYELVTAGTNGAVNGTLGTVAAAAYTAGTVREMTVTNPWADGTYFVAFQEKASAVNASQVYLSGYITYVTGR